MSDPKAITSDFGLLATNTEFKFKEYNGSVDWEHLDKISVDDIVSKSDVQSLSTVVASILCYNIEKMSVTKKIFRLSQLIIDFLMHCKSCSTFLLSDKMKSKTLCEFCGKMFVDMNYLKYHCFRQHGFNSCTTLHLSENAYVQTLKSEIVLLQTKLKEINISVQNKAQDSGICLEKNNLEASCNTVHKNKLLYHLIPQSGDNPMQIQEMYWKQKYNSLEKNYKTLKNEFEKEQNTSKTKTVLQHKYQQCDLNTDEESSKYLQTVSIIEQTIPMCSIQSLQNTDAIIENEICCMDISNTDKTNIECQQWNGNGSIDKDVSELIKLRQEAFMNVIENKTNADYEYSEPLLYSDYGNQIKIVLTPRQIQADELLRNTYLIDLIKYDVKELVNKRLLEYYNSATEIDEHDATLHQHIVIIIFLVYFLELVYNKKQFFYVFCGLS